ncbi:HNH endonuclease [Vagococcus sp. BWB3-3]|uniref:HNH endonuclease n=1 Tax=Vagococcus allomyrinae TaxID=2794353 RepID=A0A940PB22_9ENTE|nr:HNH endonuclease [Vagococcus allomyrinae]MBP1041709.1 HNH endonuclease [Vagococcus allomyrinae]
MDYYRFKSLKAYCPKCSRKLELLFPEEENTGEGFYICFKCRTISQFGVGALTSKNSLAAFKTPERKKQINQVLDSLPANFQYKAKGSQLRLTGESYTRQWLSIREYRINFDSEPPSASLDLRVDLSGCKWCGEAVTKSRRSFCSDRCSRSYTKATFRNRTIAALPYRIACRDRFFCRATGQDLAITNKHGIRIPASNGQLDVHHLILVSQGGSDHESNLITLTRDVHHDYHRKVSYATEIIDEIRDQQLALHQKEMTT